MKYTDLSKDDKQDWLKQDITKAFLHELNEAALDHGDTAISAVKSGENHTAAIHAGVQEGFRRAIDIAEGGDADVA